MPTTSSRPWLKGDCTNCPLAPARVVRGFGVGGGIVAVGESPGRQEVSRGRPFVGPSGKLLRAAFKACGVDPETVYYTNSVLCNSSTKPAKEAIASCHDRLISVELPLVTPSKILLLGAAALQTAISPKRAVPITKNRGRAFYTMVNGVPVYTVATWHPAAVLRDPALFRDLGKDIAKLVQNERVWEGKPDVYVLWKKQQCLRKLTELFQASVMSCDIETTGFDITSDLVLSIGFGVLYTDQSDRQHLGASYIVPYTLIQDPDVKALLIKLLTEHPGVALPFHNGPFDLMFLNRDLGIPLSPPNYADTMLTNYALDERSQGEEDDFGNQQRRIKGGVHGLKDLSRYHFDAEDYHFDFKNFFSEPITKKSLTRLYYYQGLDCFYTALLWRDKNKELEEAEEDSGFRGKELLQRLIYPAAIMLAQIKAHGLLGDPEYADQYLVESSATVLDLLTELKNLVQADTGMVDFNPNSVVQMRELLYNRWKVGKQVDSYHKDTVDPTSKVILQRLAELAPEGSTQHRIIMLIRKFRVEAKLLSTYAKNIRSKMAESDNRVRPNLALHGTVTGRFACSQPNLQNVPARIGPAIQRIFIAPPGYCWVEADFSQLELRIAAEYSRDQTLLDIFLQGKDIHAETGSFLFSKPADKITFVERKLTKTMVFGVVYGRGYESILNGRELQYLVEEQGEKHWTIQQAKDFQTRFMSRYPGLERWIVEKHQQAIRQHYVESPTGRRRRFPLILPGKMKAEIERQAANFPIQSLAFDMCLDAMIRLHNELPSDTHVILNVHDALMFEVPIAHAQERLDQIRRTMEDVRLIPTTVPFPIEIKIGTGWGDCKKLKLGDALPVLS
jgi:uracil-DNA glycosylase family 4